MRRLATGRPINSAWNKVTPVGSDKRHVSCKKCMKLLTAKIERIRPHVKDCFPVVDIETVMETATAESS